MTDEILQQYADAESRANQIGEAAKKLDEYCREDLDSLLKKLFADDWESAGAEEAQDKYETFSSQYEGFYEKIEEMKTVFLDAIQRAKDTDKKAGNAINEYNG